GPPVAPRSTGTPSPLALPACGDVDRVSLAAAVDVYGADRPDRVGGGSAALQRQPAAVVFPGVVDHPRRHQGRLAVTRRGEYPRRWLPVSQVDPPGRRWRRRGHAHDRAVRATPVSTVPSSHARSGVSFTAYTSSSPGTSGRCGSSNVIRTFAGAPSLWWMVTWAVMPALSSNVT